MENLSTTHTPQFLCATPNNIYIVYSGVTVTLLAEHNHLPNIVAIIYCTICALALASHAKTMFTDPGAVPLSAVPLLDAQHSNTVTIHTMCSHCQSYKPPISHHCRICNRCISRMDHHCPWMNNCVGAGNMSKWRAIAIVVFAIYIVDTHCLYLVVMMGSRLTLTHTHTHTSFHLQNHSW